MLGLTQVMMMVVAMMMMVVAMIMMIVAMIMMVVAMIMEVTLITQGLSKPCVMDIKIGVKTYGPDASEAKQRSEEGKYSGTKLPLGFSVLGIIVHSGGNVHRWTKNYGRKLAASDVDEVLENYLNTGQMQKKRRKSAKMIATRFLQQLEEILTLFRTQTKFHIFASSLLFVYDSSLMETEVIPCLILI